MKARSWFEVSQATYESLVLGKTYRFAGRKGKVIEKSASPGADAMGRSVSRPMIRVLWLDRKES